MYYKTVYILSNVWLQPLDLKLQVTTVAYAGGGGGAAATFLGVVKNELKTR